MRKAKFKKLLSILCVLSLFISLSSVTFAYDNEIKGISAEVTSATEQTYSMSYLNTLSYDELVDTISRVKWNDIPDLFKYNNDSHEFYSNDERMQALIDALAQKGSNFTAEDHLGIPTLIEVLRSGYYLGFYNEPLAKLKTREERSKCIPAILSIQNNPNYKLGTSTQDEIASAVGLLIWNSASNSQIVSNAANIVKDYNQNFDSYITQKSKGDAVYNTMGGIEYDLDTAARLSSPQETEFFGNIDSFIEEVRKIALKGDLTAQNEWLINNGIYYIGKLGKFHSNPNRGVETLTQSMTLYPEFSPQYLQAAERIDYLYGGTNSEGTDIKYSEIKESAKKHYTPNTYVFDDGNYIFKTGDKVTEEKIKRMYWASKEVQAQFFRMVGNDDALEPGNTDDILTVVIYNSPKEYDVNRLIYGYDTDNGGMYIEGDGTFFTYERTPQESIYTLEELFRHEFTHYLQGRYVVPGLWGRGKMYEDDRLPWYEEGGAEFFAGATRVDGVKPRKSIISYLINSTPENRYTAEKTMHSKYGNWNFYNYSCVLMSYMYNNYWHMFRNITDNILKDDVAGYDNYIEWASNESSINSGYQEHMQDLIDRYDTLGIPLVADDYILNHNEYSKDDIIRDINLTAGLSNGKFEVKTSEFFKTFNYSGTYNLGASAGDFEDWKKMNQKSDEILKALSLKEWSGFDTVTCHFADYKVDSNGNAIFNIVFHGLFTGDESSSGGNNNNNNGDAISEETENNNDFEVANGPVIADKLVSGSVSDSDNSDYYYFEVTKDSEVNVAINTLNQRDINWIIYDANDLSQYVACATNSDLSGKLDAKAGKYYLIVYNLSTNTSEYKINLSGDFIKGSEVLVSEQEPNNSYEQANGPVKLNTAVTGTLTSNESKDVFFFEATESKNFNITLNKQGSSNINWLIYDASNPDNYLAYPSEITEDALTGNTTLNAGKYLVVVYKYDEIETNYTLTIQ